MDSNTFMFLLLGTVAILCFFIGSLIKKISLPSLIGYMILGLILGTSGFNIISEEILDHLSIIPEVTLSIIAFTIGSELNLSSLKKQGMGIISIILGESFFAFIFVTILVYLFTKDIALSLLFGSLAPASAPAGTVAVIQECKSKGTLTQALYAVVGFDDGLAIIIFGFAFTIAKNILSMEVTGESSNFFLSIMEPFKEISFSLILGGVIGYFFSIFVSYIKNERDIFIILIGTTFIVAGLSKQYHLSLILSNMTLGFMLSNTQSDLLVMRVRNQLTSITPLLFIFFFTIAGAHLNLSSLPALGTIGILYIVGRMTGKFLGTFLGAAVSNVERKIRRYLGLGIQSQAGVAIGLSLIIKNDISQINSTHAASIGTSIITTITATCIFFEIIGPILTRIALKKSGEIPLSERCSYKIIKK